VKTASSTALRLDLDKLLRKPCEAECERAGRSHDQLKRERSDADSSETGEYSAPKSCPLLSDAALLARRQSRDGL
jgi:hypothetical protein